MDHLELGDSTSLDRWVSDVESAAKSGNWRQAIAWSERALALGLQHARLLQFRALGRERAGRLAEAIFDLQQAQTLDADDPGIGNALGSNLTRAGRYSEAVSVLRNEGQIRPEIPETWFNLGVATMAAGDLVEARNSFEQAIVLRPDFAPALGRLAVLAAHRGDEVTALSLGQRALVLDPTNADARRATIEAYLVDKRALDAELAVLEWLRQPRLGPNAQSHAYGLLGDALEIQGREPEAFKAYSASKTAFAEANAKSFRPLDRHPLAGTLKALESEFIAIPPARWMTPVQPTADEVGPSTHVFLMGFMRSGTTLLEQALSLHPDVAVMEETEAMAEAGAALLGQSGGLTRIAETDEAQLGQWRDAYWDAVRQAGVSPQNKVFIDKLPFNGIKLPLISRLFPNARVVFALRDPRDVVLSCFQKRLQPNGFSYEMRTLEGAARFYAAYMSLATAYRTVLPLTVFDHRHEALLGDLQGSIRAACHFIGLDFQPEMANFQTAARTGKVMSQTSRQLRGGLSLAGLDRWRAYAFEMAPVASILAPWIEAYGYGGDG